MLRLVAKEIFAKKPNLLPQQYLSTKAPSTSTKSKKVSIKSDVPGLTNNCVNVPNTPVGPGAAKDKEYKNPEYFCYHVASFGEAEVELAKYRLPAPSNKVPFNR